jgi:hypothetical protein
MRVDPLRTSAKQRASTNRFRRPKTEFAVVEIHVRSVSNY